MKALLGFFGVIVKTGCGTDGALHSTNGDNGVIRGHYHVITIVSIAAQVTSFTTPAPGLLTCSHSGLGIFENVTFNLDQKEKIQMLLILFDIQCRYQSMQFGNV